MQYVKGVITDGFRQLLNGKLKPSAVVEVFRYEEPEFFHDLREVPSSAEAYIEADPEARQRWEWLIGYIHQKADDDLSTDIHSIYSSPFYRLDYSLFPPFHILSYYYRALIYCESRMILCHMDYLRHDVEYSTLRYEYYNLKTTLIDVLKRVDADVNQTNSNAEELTERLEQYIKRLLRETLIMLLMELSRRYEYLLLDEPVTEEKRITEDVIYLQLLERPIPDSFPWYITSSGIKAKLEMILPSKDYLKKMEHLLIVLQKQILIRENEEAKDELLKAFCLIEDTWLCGYLMVMPGKLSKVRLYQIDENTQRLNALNEVIDQLDKMKPEEKDAINRLVRQMSKINSALGEGLESNSAARKLIRKAENIFLGDNNRAEEPGAAYNASLSENYISVYQIAKDFSVTERTVNNRIEDYEIEFMKIGNHRWLKKAAFERLKSLLTTNKT